MTYAKYMVEPVLRDELMKMLGWYAGVETKFTKNLGGFGKYLQKYLEPELWDMLMKTYADASVENTWDALEMMCRLFRNVALRVAEHFTLEYPEGDDHRVSAHLKYVRVLPRDATEIY